MSQKKKKKRAKVIWAPQPKQEIALSYSKVYELFYGGAKGGGKSDFLLIDYTRGINEYGKDHPGIIFRRSFPELEELISRSHDIYPRVFPGARFVEGKKTWFFPSGSTLKMRFLENDADCYHYTGHQYTWVGFDELTNWPNSFPYLYMHSCIRSAKGIPVRLRASGNPGNPGHLWVKQRFVDCGEPLNVYLDENTGLTKIYIPAKLDDNIILQKMDPNYENRLKNLPEHLYLAYREGNWDVFVGQAFSEWTPNVHIIPAHDIPAGKPLLYSFDWGFGKPFSVGWWYVGNDGQLVRFSEWYGWNGNPNEGTRLADSEIAEGIISREKALDIWGKPILRLGDPGCFQKRPDYRGGGQGASTADVFASYNIPMKPGDVDRHLKKRQFHERLRIVDGTAGLVVFEGCKHFIRTVPALTIDKNDMEDIDTDTEDHVYDEAALVVMARPATEETLDIENIFA